MVVLSLEAYSRLVNPIERALDEADYQAEADAVRMPHGEVFERVRENLNVK